MFEFLLTIASRHGILSDVVDELEDMRALDPDTVRGGGGHEIPARVLRIVPRS
jgi:hypothetical protein